MHTSRISIITPSFNQAAFLEETILSIINQSYLNLEYIIIDGGSTDNSVEIIKKYEKHLTYWVSEKDNGQSEAINKGLQKATGKIIAWINSDDLLLPNALENVSKYFSISDVALIHGKSILFGNTKKEIIIGAEGADVALKCLGGMPFPQPASFFKRTVLDQIGVLDENLHYGMDYDFYSRIALNYDLLQVNSVFSKYRLHNNSKSLNNLSFAKEWTIVFSIILRTLQAYNMISYARELNLYSEGDKTFKVSKSYSFDEIKKIFLHFLLFQITWYYEAKEISTVKRLTSFIQGFDKKFYKENNLHRIHIRASILNPTLLQFLRNFSR